MRSSANWAVDPRWRASFVRRNPSCKGNKQSKWIPLPREGPSQGAKQDVFLDFFVYLEIRKLPLIRNLSPLNHYPKTMNPIPADFDLASQQLDRNEVYARDTLGITMENWARFRHAVAVGTHSENVHPTSGGSVSSEVKSMYCDIGRNHYDYICSLAAANEIYTSGNYGPTAPPLHHHRLCTGFYNNLGSALDALSRIVYIIAVPDAPTAVNNQGRLRRHLTDWTRCGREGGQVLQGFEPIMTSGSVDAMRNVRNQLTHGWMPIARIGPSHVLEWPQEVTSHRDLPWPHDPDERAALVQTVTTWVDWPTLFGQHYSDVETVGELIFQECVNQIPNFETAHRIDIHYPQG